MSILTLSVEFFSLNAFNVCESEECIHNHSPHPHYLLQGDYIVFSPALSLLPTFSSNKETKASVLHLFSRVHLSVLILSEFLLSFPHLFSCFSELWGGKKNLLTFVYRLVVFRQTVEESSQPAPHTSLSLPASSTATMTAPEKLRQKTGGPPKKRARINSISLRTKEMRPSSKRNPYKTVHV